MTTNPAKQPIYAGDWSRSAGKPYRPSNGTEGEIFQEMWCQRCVRDQYGYDAETDSFDGESCPILMNTLMLDADEEGYPTEWRYDAKGIPECTAFEPEEGCEDDGTGDLFEAVR